MRFSRYIAKQNAFAVLDARIHKQENILFYSVPARDRKNFVPEVQCRYILTDVISH